VDEDGNLYITGEYYQQNKRAGEVSDSIRGRSEVFYGDPAGKRKTENRNGVMFSLFDEYLDHGITIIPAQNDVIAGINRVAEYFKSGKIRIFSTCKNLIDELKKYHWSEEKETSSGVIEPKPYKSYDHACDCLRYLVASRAEGSKPEPKKVVRFSEADFERMEEQQAHYDEVA
jgi:phage terminase large subunit